MKTPTPTINPDTCPHPYGLFRCSYADSKNPYKKKFVGAVVCPACLVHFKGKKQYGFYELHMKHEEEKEKESWVDRMLREYEKIEKAASQS